MFTQCRDSRDSTITIKHQALTASNANKNGNNYLHRKKRLVYLSVWAHLCLHALSHHSS